MLLGCFKMMIANVQMLSKLTKLVLFEMNICMFFELFNLF